MPYVKQERRAGLDLVVERIVHAKLSMEDWSEFLRTLAGAWKRCDRIPNYQRVLDEVEMVGAIPNGDINYILFKFAKYHIPPSYNNYKDFLGVIHDAIDYITHNIHAAEYRNEYRETVAEIRRRLLAPYEDLKIKENGDV